MPNAAPQPPQTATLQPCFTGYILAPGGAGLVAQETIADFTAAMAGKTAQGLIVYVAPQHAIACAMQDGASPAAAQDAWHTAAAPYLAMLRKMRRRLTLFQMPLENAAEALQAVVQERLAAAADADLPDLPPLPPQTEPFWQALAHLHISQNPQTVDMIDIVQSHSTGAVDPIDVHDIASVLSERWRTQHDHATTQNTVLVDQIIGLEQDLAGIHGNLETALHDQQAHVQELVAQIDAYGQMVQTLTAARDAGQQALDAATNQIKTHEATQADMQSRIDKKNKQIGTLTAEREWVRDKRKAHEQEAANYKVQLAGVLAEHATALTTAQNDRATLELQLEGTAAELAQAEENHAELTAQMSEQICQLEGAMQLNHTSQNDSAKEALRQCVRQLETALASEQSRHADTKQAVEHAHAELEALHTSTSWRATKPMRSVSQLVRK